MRRRAACRARALTLRQWPAANAAPSLYPSQLSDSTIRVNHPSQVSESFYVPLAGPHVTPGAMTRGEGLGRGPGVRAWGEGRGLNRRHGGACRSQSEST